MYVKMICLLGKKNLECMHKRVFKKLMEKVVKEPCMDLKTFFFAKMYTV